MFNQKYKDRIKQLEQKNKDLNTKLNHLNKQDIKTNEQLKNNIKKLNNDLYELENIISEEQSKLTNIQDALLYQDVGYYEINCRYDSSDEYKYKLNQNKKEQKEMIKELNCLSIPNKNMFHYNNNYSQGKKIIDSFARLMLENFNVTCDKFICKAIAINCSNMIINITNLAEKLNKKGEIFNIKFKDEFVDLKIKELKLNIELKIKADEEKEYKRYQEEIIRDDLKAENELKRERKKLEATLTKAQYEYNKLHDKNKNTTEVQSKINKLEKDLEKNNYWLTHKRAGYVYVVSNSDMKEGQYKIGITRRKLEERMKELGSGASHSFQMNVHASIFVRDVYKVESDVHKFLENKRVNRSNARKEWFYCTLEEIKEAFKATNNLDITINDDTEIYDPNYIYSKKYFDFL